jgi:hypothetical protein
LLEKEGSGAWVFGTVGPAPYSTTDLTFVRKGGQGANLEIRTLMCLAH